MVSRFSKSTFFPVLLLSLLLLLLFTTLEFFTSVLTDGFSLEFECVIIIIISSSSSSSSSIKDDR